MKRAWRRRENAAIVQGEKNIRVLLDNNIKISKLGATVPDEWKFPEQIQEPSNGVLRNPELWPSKEYYVNTIDVVRKFMGPSSQPGRHELWAEVAINSLPASTLPEKEKINRVLILEAFRNDRDVGELIRTARSLAWDAGFLCGADKLDVYSPEAFRASRLQTIFFPMETTTSNEALQKSRNWGCVPIFLSTLPESQLENSQVGRPHFWRNSGNIIEESELAGKKVALIATQKDVSASPDDICMSIPLANSPTSPYQELSTLAVVQATAMAMMTLLNVTQNIKISQPTGLKPSHPEIAEGRIVTKELAKLLNVPRPLTPKQAAMKAKKKAREAFEREWMREEENWEGWEEVSEGGNEEIPGKIGTHRKRVF